MANKTKEYESTSMALDVEDIVKNSKGTRLFLYEGIIHTPDEDIGVFSFDQLEMTRDYIRDVHAPWFVQFTIGLGDYIYRVYPYRFNLEMTITRTPMQENGTKRKTKENILVKRYKVVFNPKHNPPVATSDLQTADRESLNETDMPRLQFELVDRHAEPLRVKMTSGIYQDKTIEELIRATLAHESRQVLVDGKPAIDALELDEPDNKEKVAHLILKSGTTLSAVPTLLQKDNGVYNGSIGTFYQEYRKKKTWFVYSLYDAEKFEKAAYRAIFYAVPQDRLPQLDMSYWEDGNVLKIAVTAQRLYTDSAELNMMNKGSGFRAPDARAFMKKPVEMTEECPVANRSRLNTEVTHKHRDDGLDYGPLTTAGPMENLYVRRSDTLSQYYAQVDLIWENADEELIYPGMPCKYVFLSRGEVKQQRGRILFAHILSSRTDKQDIQVFRTTMRIGIAVEPIEEQVTNEQFKHPTEREASE